MESSVHVGASGSLFCGGWHHSHVIYGSQPRDHDHVTQHQSTANDVIRKESPPFANDIIQDGGCGWVHPTQRVVLKKIKVVRMHPPTADILDDAISNRGIFLRDDVIVVTWLRSIYHMTATSSAIKKWPQEHQYMTLLWWLFIEIFGSFSSIDRIWFQLILVKVSLNSPFIKILVMTLIYVAFLGQVLLKILLKL